MCKTSMGAEYFFEQLELNSLLLSPVPGQVNKGTIAHTLPVIKMLHIIILHSINIIVPKCCANTHAPVNVIRLCVCSCVYMCVFAFCTSGETPAYHYGTHYSSAMIVASYLVRMEPFTQIFLRLQV